MATISLTGNLATITGKPVDATTTATIKKPFYSFSNNTQVNTTNPVKLDVSSNGDFTANVVPGEGWLYVEGAGWSDSIRFVAAEGMTSFFEAWANAQQTGVFTMIKELIDVMGGATGDELSKLVEQARIYADAAQKAQASGVAWDKGVITSAIGTLDNAPVGVAEFSAGESSALGSPVAQPGTVRTVQVNAWKYQWVTSAASGKSVTYKRIYTGTAWTAWEKEATPWSMGVLDSAKYTLDTMPDGLWIIQLADRSKVGAPVAGRGWVQQITSSGWRYQQFTTAVGGRPVAYSRVYADGKWFDWSQTVDKKEMDAAISAAVSSIPTGSAGGPVSGFKIVPVALTVGNDGGVKGDLSGSWRIPVRLNAPIIRWRLCVSTMGIRTGQPSGAEVRLANVRYGNHAGNGAFDSNSTSYPDSELLVPADGSTVKLPWVSYQFGQGKDLLVHFDYTSTGTVQPIKYYGHGFQVTSGAATDIEPTVTKDQRIPLDWRIEVETYATTPVVGAFGDSLTCGQGAVDSLQASWLSQYCYARQALPMHYSLAGDTMQRWVNLGASNYVLRRLSGGASPDAIILQMGSNDVGVGASLTDMQARFQSQVSLAQTFTSAVYAGTIFPREGFTSAQNTVRNDFNTWVKSQLDQVRDVFDTAAPLTDADGTLVNAYNSGDNVHINDAGYKVVAEAITRPVTTPPVAYLS